MLATLRGAWTLLFGVALLALGNGLQGTLLGVRASLEDFGPVVTGVVMSAYSVGLLVGSFETPKLISQVGHIRVFAAFASIISTAALVFSIAVTPVTWLILRFMTGICMSGLYIVAESWLNQASSNENRGKLLSIYMTITFSFMGIGQLLMNVADPSGFILFILVSALVSIALVPISLSRTEAPRTETPRSIGIAQIYRRSPLAVVACFGNGLAQSAFFSMGAVYCILQEFSIAETSILMGLPLIGVVLSQYPMGILSDSFDRRKILTIFTFLSAGLALVCLAAAKVSFVGLAAAIALFGSISLPLYSLAIAHANDNMETDELLGAAGKLVLIFGTGASAGPFIAGAAMQQVGPQGFFIYLGVIYVLIGMFAVYRMTQREALPLEEQGDYMLVVPRSSSVAVAAVVEQLDASSDEEASEEGSERAS